MYFTEIYKNESKCFSINKLQVSICVDHDCSHGSYSLINLMTVEFTNNSVLGVLTVNRESCGFQSQESNARRLNWAGVGLSLGKC